MMLPFHKMHGAGNDFVVVDARAGLRLTRAQVTALSDRRTGIGCDQFITLEPPPPGADVFMRIQNPDGGEAGACGNATRCVADLLFRETGVRQQTIRTIAGDLPSSLLADGRVAVDMGPARLKWADIPLARAMDTLHLELPGDPAAISMGNPHATFFVPDAEAWPAAQDGPRFEHDALFPERSNVGFAQILDPGRIRLRVWERGAGLTRSCGSGACAAAVNAHRRGLTGRQVEVITDGGMLEIDWREDGHVLMTGPVATSFTGQVDLDGLAAGAA
jgi:diaminopimelate epimerase